MPFRLLNNPSYAIFPLIYFAFSFLLPVSEADDRIGWCDDYGTQSA